MEEDERMVVSLREPAPTRSRFLSERSPRRNTNRRMQAYVAMGVAGIILLVGIWYAFFHHGANTGTYVAASGTASSTVADPQAAAEQTAAIVAKVGELIDLPSGETPTVATVTDPDKLQDQPFFANAKIGDIVLLYTVAREAYLYDPVRDKLVEVAPITTATGQQ